MSDLAAARTPALPRVAVAAPYALVLAAAVAIPFVAGDYWTVIATRAAVYWVLVAGLNLVVGFAGQLAIGYVALLTVGAYTASALAEKLGVPPPLALVAAGLAGAVGGVVVGLPALRLRTFYFAMSTLGFRHHRDASGARLDGRHRRRRRACPARCFAAPFDSTEGFYALCMGMAAARHACWPPISGSAGSAARWWRCAMRRWRRRRAVSPSVRC